MSAQRRHSRITKLQAKIFGVIAGGLLALTVAFGGIQAVQNHEASQATASAEIRAEFWQVVAGDKAPQSATSANKLAVNLRDSLGTIDSTATELPEAIQSFAAGPSDYPGINEELGINAFNDQGLSCSDCGPLDGYIQNQLLEIKQGNVQQVASTELSNAPKVDGLHLTPLGMPIIAWVSIVYLAGGAASLMAAVRIDSRRNDYNRVLLDWKKDGGSSADPYKKISKAISPGYFLAVLPLQNKFGKDMSDILREVNLLEDDITLDAFLKQVEALPPGSTRDQLRNMLEELKSGIDEQVSNYLGRDRDFANMEAQALSNRVGEITKAIADKLEARASAHRELNSGVSEPSQRTIDEIEGSLDKGLPSTYPPQG